MADETIEERLPFLAHMEELRKRLVRSLVAVLLGFILCFQAAPQIFAFLTAPVVEALRTGSAKVSAETVEKAVPPGEPLSNDGRKALRESVVRVLLEGPARASVEQVVGGLPPAVAGTLSPEAVRAIEDAVRGEIAALPAKKPGLIYTGISESFFTGLKVAFFASLLLTLPFILWQVWGFVSPGLFKKERKYLAGMVVASTLLFLGGAAFCYFVVFPAAFGFFLSPPYASDTINPYISMKEYLTFITRFILAFGVIFQMPLLAFFFTKLGMVNHQAMGRFRRYALIINFLIAAFLTPTPDVINQLLMAGPLIVLYEISILVSRFTGGKPKEEPAG